LFAGPRAAILARISRDARIVAALYVGWLIIGTVRGYMSDPALLPGNAAIRILEHETTFRLAMVTAPMRRLPILLLMSKGYGESATAARCQSPSDRIRK
jgi:hypothetical protein